MRFKHDCSACKPLGEFNEFDLYYCQQDPNRMATVLARFGNKGLEYTSGLHFVEVKPELAEAFRRAKEAGLVNRAAMAI
jgi:hypothetical protein